MKPTLLTIACLSFLLSCCQRFSTQELSELPLAEAGPLQLTPSFELFEWRYDLIRQQEAFSDSEGNPYYRNVDYHPVGFDLGNGLFLDMNDNLSFRVDRLLGIDYGSGGTFNRIASRRFGPSIIETHALDAEELCISRWRDSVKGRQLCIPYEISEEGVLLHRHNEMRPIIRFSTIGMEFPSWSTRYHSIRANDEGHFEYRLHAPGKIKLLDLYERYDSQLFLRNHFLVERSVHGNEIRISRIRPWGNDLQYTIRFSTNRMIVYRPNRTGFTLTFEEKGLHFRTTNGEDILYRYEDDLNPDEVEVGRSSTR